MFRRIRLMAGPGSRLRPEPALRSRPSGDDPLRAGWLGQPSADFLSFARGRAPPVCKGQALRAPAGRIPDLPPVGRADRVIPLIPPSALQLEPPLIGAGQPVACATRLSRKEGRKGRGVTVRASSKKESDHVAIRITVSVTASRREPAPEDRPQGHRGACRQHQDRWRPA